MKNRKYKSHPKNTYTSVNAFARTANIYTMIACVHVIHSHTSVELSENVWYASSVLDLLTSGVGKSGTLSRQWFCIKYKAKTVIGFSVSFFLFKMQV
jgi:hypothetical protein